jgi:hypothetical protein
MALSSLFRQPAALTRFPNLSQPSALFGISQQSVITRRCTVPVWPPKPLNWGTGPLRYRWPEHEVNQRFKQCSEIDQSHIVPGDRGPHVEKIQIMLILNIAFANPGFWAELRGKRASWVNGLPNGRRDSDESLITDREIFNRWNSPFELHLKGEFGLRTGVGVYGPKTTALILGWKQYFDIRREGQKTVDNIVGKQTIRSLDFYYTQFSLKFINQLDTSNTKPWL